MTATDEHTGPLPLEERYPIPEGKTGIMHQLCNKGDVPIMWNRNEPEEVAIARKAFDDARKAGFIIYKAEGKDGHRGEVVKRFDPADERLIMVRQHVGG